MYCNVIVNRPFNQVFTYDLGEYRLKIGQIVQVPFGRSIELGMVIETNVLKPEYKIKKIYKVFPIILSKTSIEFIYWINEYTLAPIGLILKLFIINEKIIDFKTSLKSNSSIKIQNVKLNKEQLIAKKNINKFIKTSSKPIVLEGVTGSGKTEVYFDIIAKYIIKKKQILIMLPEISLTPQLETRFIEKFGIKVDVWHSKISDIKRKEIWHRAYNGESIIVIGARSSLFIPFSNLGLIIVDEEHDHSYKQEDNLRYQARDLAVVRAKLQKCCVILSSATPSLETQNNINKKKYHHVFLSKQFSGLPLPSIELIDLNINKPEKNNWISYKIINELKECVNKKEQALIFLNRRGYSPLSLCEKCGYRFECKQCSSWLVMHQKKNRLLCHHCGNINDIQNNCPKCFSSNSIKFVGPGVERIAEEVSKHFSDKKILIMSSDNANTPNKVKKIIYEFTNKKIDILVATQIMAKGYDFPNLSFVGVIDADAGLFGGDMRAVEKTFNLLQQVSGRAGRSKQAGKVMIQTYYPDQPVIKAIKKRDRKSFVTEALKQRQIFKIPPYGFMTSIIISGASKSLVKNYALKLIQIPKIDRSIELLGPVEATIFLLRGKYRYRILLKGNNRKNLNIFNKKMLNFVDKPSSVKVVVDVDPYSFM